MSALARLIAARMLGKSKRQSAKPSPIAPPAKLVSVGTGIDAPVVLEPPRPVLQPGWKGSCKAIDADTGRQCRLPAHPGEAHRHERGPFFRAAPPEQTHFRAREQLDAAATRRNHSNNEAP